MYLYVDTKYIGRTGTLSSYTVSCEECTDFSLPTFYINILPGIWNRSRFSCNLSRRLGDNSIGEVNRSCFDISIITVDSKIFKVYLVDYWIELFRPNSLKLSLCHWSYNKIEIYVGYGIHLKSKCCKGY